MAGEIAAADHRHPHRFIPLRQQLPHHRLTHRIAGPTDAGHPLIHEGILEQQPAQFMGEFERLDQPQFFQLTQRPALSQANSPLQRGEGAPEIHQPLSPANVRGGHGARLALQTT